MTWHSSFFHSVVEPGTATPPRMWEIIKQWMNTNFLFVFPLQWCIERRHISKSSQSMVPSLPCYIYMYMSIFRKIYLLFFWSILVCICLCMSWASKLVLVPVDKLCVLCHWTGTSLSSILCMGRRIISTVNIAGKVNPSATWWIMIKSSECE